MNKTNLMCVVGNLKEAERSNALAVADRAFLLVTGKITLWGTRDELLDDPNVIRAYLGGRS